MRSPSVCVVGSVNVDFVVAVESLPRPGETVAGNEFTLHPGGKGANQAVAARRQGANVRLVAKVGDDIHADTALEVLRADGVDLSCLVVEEGVSTGVALVIVDHLGENQIAVVPGANARLRFPEESAAGFDVVLCQMEIGDEALIAAAKGATGLFCLNAAPAREIPAVLLEKTDIVIVNEIEREELADQLQGFAGLTVVTRGKEGAAAYKSDVLVESAPAPMVQTVDTVGAGDAFCGALSVALASSTAHLLVL